MLDLIDIGANLTHDSFDADRGEVMSRAHAAGVTRMIITGATEIGSQQALELARQHPAVLYATAGIHPHHAKDFSEETVRLLRELVAQPETVAVGECGLDYFRDFSPRDAQQYAFEHQLALAAEIQKPVFLHQRDAHEAFLQILKKYWPDLSGGVAHCFTGNREQMQTYLEMGLFIGITGWICDERRGDDLRTAVASLPLDRVMIETDAPYLLPRNVRPKPSNRRNEPALLPHVLQTLAECMSVDSSELAAAATQNTQRLFGLPAKAAT